MGLILEWKPGYATTIGPLQGVEAPVDVRTAAPSRLPSWTHYEICKYYQSTSKALGKSSTESHGVTRPELSAFSPAIGEK